MTRSLVVATGLSLLYTGCWVGGGDNPSSTFELSPGPFEAARRSDDAIDISVDVGCSATERTVASDPSTEMPGDCPTSEWCLTARWFPRSALDPAPTGEEGGTLLFDVTAEEIQLAGEAVAEASSCQTDDARPPDGAVISVSATTDGPVMGTDLVIDAVLERRQAGVPSDLRVVRREILVSP